MIDIIITNVIAGVASNDFGVSFSVYALSSSEFALSGFSTFMMSSILNETGVCLPSLIVCRIASISCKYAPCESWLSPEIIILIDSLIDCDLPSTTSSLAPQHATWVMMSRVLLWTAESKGTARASMSFV